MQEIIIDILLGAVIIAAAVLLCVVGTKKGGMTKKQRTMMIRILVCSTILFGLQFATAEMFDSIDKYLFPSAGRWLRFACYLADYFIIGYDILKKAAKGIKGGIDEVIKNDRGIKNELKEIFIAFYKCYHSPKRLN